MKAAYTQLHKLVTPRLSLYPYSLKICEEISQNNFASIKKLGLKKGLNWPDADVLETLPRIILNLSKVATATGFESWMIVKNETQEIIGDIGFKGYNFISDNCDLGYGIIEAERRNGYAEEAARALIKWAFTTEELQHITANCLHNNSSSKNLLTKLGFQEINSDEEMIYWRLKRNV